MKEKKAEAVLGFIKANPGSTIDDIVKGSKVGHIMVTKALNDLQNENLVEANADDGTYSYMSKGNEAPQVTEPKSESKKAEKKVAEKDNDLGPATPSGRNNDRYTIDTMGLKALPKGRFVLAIVRKHCEVKKLSLAKLQEVFDSKTIQPRFGVVEEVNAAKKFSKNGKDRFLMKPEDVFRTADSKKAVCCSQWTSENIKPFLQIVKDLGYKFKVE